MLLGNLQAGLYNVADSHVSSPLVANTRSCLSAVDTAKLWHLRLGHLPFDQLNLALPDCNAKSLLHDTICTVCPAARQTRKPFPKSSIKTTKAFEMLHVDVWGPYRIKTHRGCNQFLTIVDDYTRFIWVHLLRYKTEVVSILTDFFQYVQIRQCQGTYRRCNENSL